MRSLASLLLLLLFTSCSATGMTPGVMLPTPFTAEQIEDACPAGSAHVFLIEETGEEPKVTRTTFLQAPGEPPRHEQSRETLDGTQVGEPVVASATWEELRDHAAFPAAWTTKKDSECVVEAGSFDCWLYEMTQGKQVHRFWFAKSKPGPPVLYERSTEGAVTYRMELIEHVLPGR